ncbi:hypothetical protein BJV74DRAFT_815724 [Russula compacta]|nr:hypothetical protein BJV74DRAFT_815724 [Russula compacta]
MPLHLPSLSLAIICDGIELETHDAKHEGPSSIRAFVASEAGKQFSITFHNNLLDFDLSLNLHIDGELVYKTYLPVGRGDRILGIYKDSTSVLPFKFQELELVDPDQENAPVVPEMGTIELRAFRSRARHVVEHQPYANRGLHQGRVSELSKKAGWHHVSTADEVPANGPRHAVIADYIDPRNAPCASFKIFYRPRALLMAQGVIAGHGAGAASGSGTSGSSGLNDRKRGRMDGSPGPSKRRSGATIKKEETPVNTRALRIRALQVSGGY